MYIISFDVGIRNLGFVIIQLDEKNINQHTIDKWDVLELCDKNTKASSVDNIIIGMNMYKLLDELLSDYDFDVILIENQIGRNAIKMKTIQGMLNMYFVMRGYNNTNIINYNAVHKLKHFLKNKKTTYTERKKLSKQITEQLCKLYYGDEIFNYYKKFKKKDDLADCLLQCLDYIKKQKLLNDEFYNEICINELKV